MYIPKLNCFDNPDEVFSFMEEHNFATVVTARHNIPSATQLPVILGKRDGSVIITAHFAKANSQWEDIENENVLVLFNGPHAYISPKNYETPLNVPTWNYLSVHAYGKGEIIRETTAVFKILEATIDVYEPKYKGQWDGIPNDYKLKLVQGIVAFEITVTDLQAKKKLSQNRSKVEQQTIIETLGKSPVDREQEIGRLMKKIW